MKIGKFNYPVKKKFNVNKEVLPHPRFSINKGSEYLIHSFCDHFSSFLIVGVASD